jgi:hypothetical protein
MVAGGVALALRYAANCLWKGQRVDRFGWTPDDLSGEDVIAVGVQDTYVDSGIGVAQVTWSDPDNPDQRLSGLVQVTMAEGRSLSRLMHRTLYVRRSDIQDAATRFDQWDWPA